MWSSVVNKYQLGFVFQAASVTTPFTAASPHGTCEFAMNSATSGFTSAAKAATNFWRSRSRRPSCGGRIGGAGAPGGAFLIREPTDSPLSKANAATYKEHEQRTLSPGARAKIGAAQRARWAKTRKIGKKGRRVAKLSQFEGIRVEKEIPA